MKILNISKKRYIAGLTAAALLMSASCTLMTGCAGDEPKSVEEEVAERLLETIPAAGAAAEADAAADTTETGADGTDAGTDGSEAGADGAGAASGVSGSGSADSTSGSSSPTATARGGSSTSSGTAKNVNPFLGDTSTSTVFNIKFSIETDSGVAGITFGSTDGTDGEYYLFAFDCTRDIPMLYTSRRIDDAVYDEAYTNLDFMYPEMDMFTQVEHIVEIKVNGNIATTYLDSYEVCDTTLKTARPCGQFGTWVMDGDYHEYIDNLFVAEGIEGDGEWIYSDDFAHVSNLFYPDLRPRSGRLYAKSGYYTAPHKEK